MYTQIERERKKKKEEFTFSQGSRVAIVQWVCFHFFRLIVAAGVCSSPSRLESDCLHSYRFHRGRKGKWRSEARALRISMPDAFSYMLKYSIHTVKTDLHCMYCCHIFISESIYIYWRKSSWPGQWQSLAYWCEYFRLACLEYRHKSTHK